MFNTFKKKNKPNNDLLGIWLNFARENGFSEGQILGLAYFNSAIPTVLAIVNQDQTIAAPLQNVISDVGNASSEGANVLYLFKELFFAALIFKLIVFCLNPLQTCIKKGLRV